MKKFALIALSMIALTACESSNNNVPVPQNQSDESGIYNDQSDNGPTLLNITCDIRDTGMYSDVQGTYYSWTYWNNWSDGSRTVNDMGQGYDPPYDC